MEISDEVFINSMNDISKHFQIMLDNKDKRIADLQLQLDQAKSEITKYMILLNDMETENSHLETMLDQANERLKGAIIPKFKIGQEVWFISDPDVDVYRKVRHIKVEDISISSFFTERGIMYSGGDWAGLSENELFATKEEAEKNYKSCEVGNEKNSI